VLSRRSDRVSQDGKVCVDGLRKTGEQSDQLDAIRGQTRDLHPAWILAPSAAHPGPVAIHSVLELNDSAECTRLRTSSRASTSLSQRLFWNTVKRRCSVDALLRSALLPPPDCREWFLDYHVLPCFQSVVRQRGSARRWAEVIMINSILGS
jgi:hypothetical protein